MEKYERENSTTKSGYCVTNCTLPETCPYCNECHNIELKCNVERINLDAFIIPFARKITQNKSQA